MFRCIFDKYILFKFIYPKNLILCTIIILFKFKFIFQDKFISFLNSTKAHVQKECEILSDLKLEFGKFVDKLTKDNEVKTLFSKIITEYK